MSTVADLPQDLIDRVAALSPSQRDALFALFPADTTAPDPELKAKLTQRWQDYQSGKIQAISFEESDRRLRQLLEELEVVIVEGNER